MKRPMRFGLPGSRGSFGARDEVTPVDLARTAENLGYDSLWLSEEHFVLGAKPPRQHYSPLILAAAIAAVTRRIRIGFTPLYPTLYDPIRLAEDLASIDRVSRGRLDFGVGWPSDRDAEAFGRGDRPREVEQSVAAVLAYWGGEEVALNSGPTTIEPTPIQVPHPPVYVHASNKAAALWAAQHGFARIFSSFQSDAIVGNDIVAFAQMGGNATDSPVARFCLIAPTDARARAIARPLVEGVCVRLGDGARPPHVPDAPRNLDRNPERFLAETAIVGSPDTVVRRIRALRDDHAVRCINLRPSFLGSCPLPQQELTAKLFAREVRPHLG